MLPCEYKLGALGKYKFEELGKYKFVEWRGDASGMKNGKDLQKTLQVDSAVTSQCWKRKRGQRTVGMPTSSMRSRESIATMSWTIGSSSRVCQTS